MYIRLLSQIRLAQEALICLEPGTVRGLGIRTLERKRKLRKCVLGDLGIAGAEAGVDEFRGGRYSR